MKNNLENKAKFFAQYFKQKVYKNSVSKNSGFCYPDLAKIPDDGYLELNPLSQISDEDALKVAKIINPGSFLTDKKWQVNHIDNANASYIDISSARSAHFFEIDYDGYLHIKDEETGETPFMVLPEFLGAFDYLRSKGYALPFNGLSVDQQIEYGWAKFKEK